MYLNPEVLNQFGDAAFEHYYKLERNIVDEHLIRVMHAGSV